MMWVVSVDLLQLHACIQSNLTTGTAMYHPSIISKTQKGLSRTVLPPVTYVWK